LQSDEAYLFHLNPNINSCWYKLIFNPRSSAATPAEVSNFTSIPGDPIPMREKIKAGIKKIDAG